MAGSPRTPPRFVPTLTAVVDEPPAGAAPVPAGATSAMEIQEQLLHRVLQRIDLSLEERLTDAVSAAVQQQLDSMLPRLRVEIEQVLRSVVVEALARELSDDTGSAPGPGPLTFG